MKFSYTALTSGNQKVSGLMEAASLEAITENLHQMGLSIIEVKEISDEEWQTLSGKSTLGTFYFEAEDQNHQPISGTIDAAEEWEAYRRLIGEYHFHLNILRPLNGTEGKTEEMAAKIEAYKKRLQTEEDGQEIKTTANRELDEAAHSLDVKVAEEIDQTLIECNKALTEHADLFLPETMRRIQSSVDELKRIRNSNNIKHITEVLRLLYETISHPDAERAAPSEPYQAIVKKIKESTLLQEETPLYEKAVSLENMKSMFGLLKNKVAVLEGNPKNKPLSRWEQLKTAWMKKWKEKKTKIQKMPTRKEESMESGMVMKEASQFTGWLIFFYGMYFFLADFALEKKVGLPREFIAKTLQSPLLLNLTLLLLMAHVLIMGGSRAKGRPFTLFFLFAFGLGAYILITINA